MLLFLTNNSVITQYCDQLHNCEMAYLVLQEVHKKTFFETSTFGHLLNKSQAFQQDWLYFHVIYNTAYFHTVSTFCMARL